MNREDKVELYKTLVEQEVSNHTIFISVLLGIVIIVIGSTWWWNKNGAVKEIESEVEKKFNKEKKRISRQFNKKIKQKIKKKVREYEGQIMFIEADVARSMAISASNNEFYSHSIYWFSKYVENNLKLDILPNVRNGIEWIIADLELLKSQDKGQEIKFIHSCNDVVEIIKQLPDVLEKEKRKILRDCIGRYNADEDYEDRSDEKAVEKKEKTKKK